MICIMVIWIFVFIISQNNQDNAETYQINLLILKLISNPSRCQIFPDQDQQVRWIWSVTKTCNKIYEINDFREYDMTWETVGGVLCWFIQLFSWSKLLAPGSKQTDGQRWQTLKEKHSINQHFNVHYNHSKRCEIENDIFVDAEKAVFCRQMLINK